MRYARQANATIERVRYGKEDRGALTCWVYLDGDGWGQGFGGLLLDEKTGPVFVRGLCAAFGVTDIEALAGQTCTALYAFDGFNEPIEALAGSHGTFSLNEWRRSLDPSVPTLIEERRRQLTAEAERAARRHAEAYTALSAFNAKHVDD